MDIHLTLERFFQYLGMQLLKKLAHINFCFELTEELPT